MRYRLNLVTGPVCEPLDVAEVKTHLRLDGDDEDAYLESLITVARQSAEEYTGRAINTQTWQMFLDHWPNQGFKEPWWDGVVQGPQSILTGRCDIEIPKPPLQSITHIKTYDDSDTATTMSTDNYYVSAYSGVTPQSGRATLRDGAVWPTFERNADGIEIQFVAGYGDQSDVPNQLKQALLEEVAYRYMNRGDCEGSTTVCSENCKNLLQLMKVRNI